VADTQSTTGDLILIVDDESSTLNLLAKVLEKHEYRVLKAGNGKDALDRMREHRDVDLILSDIMMPKMDGYELFQKVRNDPKTSHVPFIFFSQKGSLQEKVFGLNLGADDYITKPVNPKELLLRVTNILKRIKAMQCPSLSKAEISGKLKESSLLEILQFLYLSNRTGCLEIVSGMDHGEIWISYGQLHSARIGNLIGEAAIYEMMCFCDGFFQFQEKSNFPRKNTSAEVMLLAMKSEEVMKIRLEEEQKVLADRNKAIENSVNDIKRHDYIYIILDEDVSEIEEQLSDQRNTAIANLTEATRVKRQMEDIERKLTDMRSELAEIQADIENRKTLILNSLKVLTDDEYINLIPQDEVVQLSQEIGGLKVLKVDSLSTYNEMKTKLEKVMNKIADHTSRLAGVYMTKADNYWNEADYRSAAAFHNMAIELCERLMSLEDQLDLANYLAKIYVSKAGALSKLGGNLAAVQFYDKAMKIKLNLIVNHGWSELLGDLAWIKICKAEILTALGQADKAKVEAKKAITMLHSEYERTGRSDFDDMLTYAKKNLKTLFEDSK